MKVQLELIIHEKPDGRQFLNFWDYNHGNDICCQIVDGKIFKMKGGKFEKELSLEQFIKLVHKKASKP